MPIAINGQLFKDEFEYAVNGFDPKEMASTLNQQDVGGGTGADAYNQPLADYKHGVEMDNFVPRRGAQDVQLRRSSEINAPITDPEEDLSKVPRITVTPKYAEPPPEDRSSGHREGDRYYGKLNLSQGLRRITGSDGEERVESWPEKAVRGLISGFMLPGDVAAGTVDPDSAEAKGRAFELAGGMVFGPAPVAGKIVDGTLGSIAGIKSKTANLALYDSARELEKLGQTKDQIWKATGWYKGLEGKWRHEIPDNTAKFTNEFVDTIKNNLYSKKEIIDTPLEKVLNHPELFKAYPELKNVNIQMDNSLKSYGAAHHYPDGHVELAINPYLILKDGQYHPLEVVLHEIQHAIQRTEGFNQGTNPKAALEKAIEFLRERAVHNKYSEELQLKGTKAAEWSAEYTRLHNLADAISKNPRASKGEKLGDILYKRTPGEIEPQMVQERAKHSLENEPPYVTESHIAKPLAFPHEVAP